MQETWKRIPLLPNYQIPEFNKDFAELNIASNLSSFLPAKSDSRRFKFADILFHNPFLKKEVMVDEADLMECEIGEEMTAAPLKKSNVGIKKPRINFNDFALSNTGLSIVKTLGRCYEMLNYMPFCTNEISISMFNIIGYYVYSLYLKSLSSTAINNILSSFNLKSSTIEDIDKKFIERKIKSKLIIKKNIRY